MAVGPFPYLTNATAAIAMNEWMNEIIYLFWDARAHHRRRADQQKGARSGIKNHPFPVKNQSSYPAIVADQRETEWIKLFGSIHASKKLDNNKKKVCMYVSIFRETRGRFKQKKKKRY